MTTRLNWITQYGSGGSINLYEVDLATVKAYGVYVIYQAGTILGGPRILRLGQGVVADRLAEHRDNLTIKAQVTRFGPAFVAFASVPAAQVSGVERYLADCYRPLIGDAFPDVKPVPVNLPFAA